MQPKPQGPRKGAFQGACRALKRCAVVSSALAKDWPEPEGGSDEKDIFVGNGFEKDL